MGPEEIEQLPKKIYDEKEKQMNTYLEVLDLETKQMKPLETEGNAASISGKNTDARELLFSQFMQSNHPEYTTLVLKRDELKNKAKKEGLMAEYYENQLKAAWIVHGIIL